MTAPAVIPDLKTRPSPSTAQIGESPVSTALTPGIFSQVSSQDGRRCGEPGAVQSSISSRPSRVTISVGVGTLRASSVMKSWSPPM